MTEHSCLCEEAKEQVEEWKKTMVNIQLINMIESLMMRSLHLFSFFREVMMLLKRENIY